jgi:hypothetical protein
VLRNPTVGASIGEPRALAYTSRIAYVSYARVYHLLVSFPDLLTKAYLAKTLTLLARPSLEGLVHGSDFC